MHACGHDGHTATLLTLAQYLHDTGNFDGTVQLIFQPAEEGGNGALRMIEEGLLERFPFDEIYGYHNWPFIPRGTFAIRPGPMLAAVDNFEINLQGKGGHAGMPHGSVDILPAAAQLVLAFQTLVSRETDPLASAVVSVTRIHTGGVADNVITGTARLGGTVRTFDDKVRDHIQTRMEAMTAAIATAYNATATFEYKRLLGATINHEEETVHCESAAAAIAGESSVQRLEPVMGGEDFGEFLRVRPGAFMAIGQAEPDPASPHNFSVHHPRYDFNDAILPIAAAYFAELAERRLPID